MFFIDGQSYSSTHFKLAVSLIFQTVTRSLPDMVNICLLMYGTKFQKRACDFFTHCSYRALVICLLGVVGVILFGEFAPQSFGTFSDAVFTIFICQTQRGWISIFNPFIAAGGASRLSFSVSSYCGAARFFQGYYVGAFFYFVVTITLTAFILKNMFVAVSQPVGAETTEWSMGSPSCVRHLKHSIALIIALPNRSNQVYGTARIHPQQLKYQNPKSVGFQGFQISSAF